MIEAGDHKARGVEAALGETGNGKVEVAVRLYIEAANEYLTWHGYFTPDTKERTLESLRHLGWAGDDLDDLTGIDRNDVTAVVEHEEYKGKLYAKVRWINSGGGLALKSRLSPTAAKAFAAQMKADVIAQRQKSGAAQRQAVASKPAQQQRPAQGGPASLDPEDGDWARDDTF